MAIARPQAVFVAAAKVGGIHANDTRPAEFLYDNLLIEANIIEAARHADVEKLLFLGSSCIYPRDAAQPLVPGALLSGPLEPTNQWYAMAKLAALKLVEACRQQYGCDYISALPCNLYGPGDRYDLAASHVLPALIRKAHEAKLAGAGELVVWGSGTPLREFLHIDDLAEACVTLLARYSGDAPVNIGSSEEITIADLARLGLLAAPVPSMAGGAGLGEEPGARRLAAVLRLVGYGSLALGRLYEGHVNALQLVALYGGPEQRERLFADARDGRPLMLLDGPTLTARRTAAVTALGLRVLSTAPVRSVALLGTGAQALAHARVLAELGEVRALHVVGRTTAQADAFADRLAAKLGGLELTAHAHLADALRTAQAVVTLTTSLRPVLPDELPAGLLVVGVGAFTPQMAELPPALLRARRVVVDALDGARHEAGDLIQAAVVWPDVTELVDHLDARPEGGSAPVFKTVGHAAWDLAAAHVAQRMLTAS